jgi:RNA polymerase sigma-70 factor (ECF subfamily)
MTDFARREQLPVVEPLRAVARTAPGPDADDAPSEPPDAMSARGLPEFRALFEEHVAYVWHTLRRLGVAERDLEDLAHDVFLKVYRARDRYDPVRSLRAWLFGFAFRMAAQYRRRARHRFEVLDDPGERGESAPSALERVIATETLDVARTALEALEINQRAVFLMHEVDGFSIPEVAEALSIPLNTAYSRLRLARKDFVERVRRLRARQGDP